MSCYESGSKDERLLHKKYLKNVSIIYLGNLINVTKGTIYNQLIKANVLTSVNSLLSLRPTLTYYIVSLSVNILPFHSIVYIPKINNSIIVTL